MPIRRLRLQHPFRFSFFEAFRPKESIDLDADAHCSLDEGEFTQRDVTVLIELESGAKSKGFLLTIPFGQKPSGTAARIKEFDVNDCGVTGAILCIQLRRSANAESGLEL